MKTKFESWNQSAAIGVMVALATGLVSAQPSASPAKPVLGFGEATGNDVYVRSGPSANHYPVCKINAGIRVTVVGETGEWLEVLPPDGTFSFVSGDYVDSPDGRQGVINGDNVRVRAGSGIEDFAQLKYVVQTHLSKGTPVQILARDPDGFLRIKPPSGVTFWISRNLVEMMPDSALTVGVGVRPSPRIPGPVDAQPGDAQGAVTETGAPDADDNALAHVETGDLRATLAELDKSVEAEVTKPIRERDFEALIPEYRKIAEQQIDTIAREYGAMRAVQVADMAALANTVKTMRRLTDEATAQRREFLERRSKIVEANPPIPAGLDAQGELRESSLYPEGKWPRRFRLVEATGKSERTIAYVEVPKDAAIDINRFIGLYVGVRAAEKRLHGGVDPVPIYVVGEIMLLDRKESGGGQPG